MSKAMNLIQQEHYNSGRLKQQYFTFDDIIIRADYFENGQRDCVYTKNGDRVYHGWCESYFDDGSIYLQGMFNNGNKIGYWIEWAYGTSKKEHHTVFYLDD